ncbi:MAG TPA: uroporphyrinogen decarboxylase [Blastocatellia bacterium]|nr:uroporphyrinogen decarboxylase [Blastocatellia bacterium]
MKNDRMLRACRGQEVDRAPVWMMRQAGRYLPEYRAIRKDTDFMTLCKTPDLAAEVSMQPYRILGVDAVIMFSDILIPVEAMGMKVDIIESKGPVIENPIRSEAQVDRLAIPDPVEKTGFVMQVLKLLRKELNQEAPLIGFAGAPYTIASYMVEGGTSRNYTEIKRMMFSNPALLHKLLGKIAETVTDYLNAQIEAGAQIVQLFDTWAGDLSSADYQEFAWPYQQRIFERLNRGAANQEVPATLYVNGCSPILEKMAETGANVLSIDWRIDIAEARRRLDQAGFQQIALQGNLDPCALLGTPETIREGVQKILRKVGPLRHIMNLGHGIMPMVPVENARAFIEAAKAGISRAA